MAASDRPDAATPAQWLESAAASAFGAARTPFDAQPFVLVDLAAGDRLAPADAECLAGWLRRQPCPVIGLAAGSGADAVAQACDVLVDSPAALGFVTDGIARAPLAAMTLVQVLRSSAALPAADALVLESLAFATLQSGPEFKAWSAANPPAPETIPHGAGPAVLVERIGTQLRLRLNRPASRNAMTVEMRDALVEAFELAACDTSIETLRVGAAGACFSIGGALEEFGTAASPAGAHAVRSIRLPAAALLRTPARSHFHVHGACIGSGIELPAFAARLTASPDAFFQLPEIRFGLIPGAGGCVGLPRRIGRQRTAYLALSARRINAATALAWGLVDAIGAPPAD